MIYLTDVDETSLTQVNAANPYGDSSFYSDSASVLIDAKRDVDKEIETLRILKEQYSGNGNTTKSVDEGEIDDVENAQDSVSEDDSDDDSDRKGTYKRMYPLICHIFMVT